MKLLFFSSMGTFLQRLSLIAIVLAELIISVFFLMQVTRAADESVTTPASDVALGSDATKCDAGIKKIFTQRTDNFEKNLRDYSMLSDVPTMELLIRAKTGLINMTADTEEICQRNLNPDASIPDTQRVAECRPPNTKVTAASPLNNMNGQERKKLNDLCLQRVSDIREEYENMILGFASWDMNNKKAYAYAKAIESLNKVIRSFNDDFGIMRGRLDKVIQSINYLVTGKNAGQ